MVFLTVYGNLLYNVTFKIQVSAIYGTVLEKFTVQRDAIVCNLFM